MTYTVTINGTETWNDMTADRAYKQGTRLGNQIGNLIGEIEYWIKSARTEEEKEDARGASIECGKYRVFVAKN